MTLDKSQLVLWGKLDVPMNKWHPLIYHMLDISNVVLELWNRGQCTIFHRYNLSDNNINTECVKNLVTFLAGLHDIGKATPNFQLRSNSHRSLFERLGLQCQTSNVRVGHGQLSSKIIYKSFAGLQNIDCQILWEVAVLVGGHHGIFEPISKRIGFALGNDSWKQARKEIVELYKQVMDLSESSFIGFQAFDKKPRLLCLAGLISFSDWIASNLDYFPLAEQIGCEPNTNIWDYSKQSKDCAKAAVDQLFGNSGNIPEFLIPFEDLFRFNKTRTLQKKIIDISEDTNPHSMYIIEAPMGEGKTEAALYLAASHLTNKNASGMYIALPTQATSNQMYTRTYKFLRDFCYNHSFELYLLHSNSQHQLSSNLSTIGENNGEQPTVQEWFLPRKRSLLAQFGIGTIDQALISVLQTRHYFVRLFGLSSKVIIIDEVHAYDTYMSKLLERLVEWLSSFGCSIILLSATLPEFKKKSLLSAFARNIEPEKPSLYPSITEISKRGTRQYRFDSHSKKRVELFWFDLNSARSITQIRNIMEKDGVVAMICNTVDQAQKLYHLFRADPKFNDTDLNLLHSRFTLEHRARLEKSTMEKYGKKRTGKASILISTQIIEQSLDLDFDLMISEMAPIDLLLQRAGRLHRHDNIRPVSLKKPHLFIVSPRQNDRGIPDFGSSGFVYSNYILLRSYLVLKDRKEIIIPDDLKSLVELVYNDNSTLKIPVRFTKILQRHKDKQDNELDEQERIADQNTIIRPDYSGRLDEGVFMELIEDDPDTHPMRKAMTRYGADGVNVVCLFNLDDESRRKFLSSDLSSKQLEELHRNSLNLSHRGLTRHIKENIAVPKRWKEYPILRYSRPLFFADNNLSIGNYDLQYDRELGIVIRRNNNG